MTKLRLTDWYKKLQANKEFKKRFRERIRTRGKGFEYLCRAKFEKEGYETIDRYYVDKSGSEGTIYREQDINAVKTFKKVSNNSVKNIEFYTWVRYIGEVQELNDSAILIRPKNMNDPNQTLLFPHTTEDFGVLDFVLKYGFLTGDIAARFGIEDLAFKFDILNDLGKNVKIKNASVVYGQCAAISTSVDYWLSILLERSLSEIRQFQSTNERYYEAREKIDKALTEEERKPWEQTASRWRNYFELFMGIYMIIPIFITKAPITKLTKRGIKEVKYFLHPFTPKHLDRLGTLKKQTLTVQVLVCNEAYLTELIKKIDCGLQFMFEEARKNLPKKFDHLVNEYEKYSRLFKQQK